jgi:hypothetical protein
MALALLGPVEQVNVPEVRLEVARQVVAEVEYRSNRMIWCMKEGGRE